MFSATTTSETNLKPKPLPLINEDVEDNNIFSKLLSKDTNSMANPSNSFRVYYGSGAAGSVPFIWESQPGTPKHYVHSLFSDQSSSLPPLTPPPSSFRHKTLDNANNNPSSSSSSSSSLFRRLLKKVTLRKTSSGPMLMSKTVKSTHDYGMMKRKQFLNRGSSFDSVFIAGDAEDHGSSYFCFQLGNSKRGSTRW